MFADDVTVTDTQGNATYRRIADNRTDRVVRYDVAAPRSEPSLLTTMHQELAPKGQPKSDKHLVSMDKVLVNGLTGIAEKSIINLSIQHPQSPTFSDAVIWSYVERIRSFATFDNVKRLLNKES